MENFTDKDVKDFADKLFDVTNKLTAGHMVEPEHLIMLNYQLWLKRWVNHLKNLLKSLRIGYQNY